MIITEIIKIIASHCYNKQCIIHKREKKINLVKKTERVSSETLRVLQARAAALGETLYTIE